VESEPGKGSAFTVRLPQERVGSAVCGAALAEKLRQNPFHCTSKTRQVQIIHEYMPYGSVLIVDDLEANLYVAKGLLLPYGLKIETAPNGFEAVEKIKNGSVYDIVFMDHMMPKMDGMEATKILRSMGYAHPIVALTANTMVGQAEMFLANGFDGFISKPVDLCRLNAFLNRLIRDKQPPEVLEDARRQGSGPHVGGSVVPPTVTPQLAGIFARNAEKAVTALEAIHTNQYRRDDDVYMFVINVHAMKSALANIGETELAAFAYKLEQAGRKRDTAALSAETPAFLDALRAVIEKIRPKTEDEDSETADEDQAYLREKLSTIQAACATYDKKAAKDALSELTQKVWSRQTRKLLDTIAAHLLYSDFKEAADVAEERLLKL
jgi:CheY-like chemotaxis protein